MTNLFKTKTFLFLFGMLFCIFHSCTEKEIEDSLTTNIPEGFEYAKSFDIKDDEGNEVTVQLAANDKSILEDYQLEDFEFNISKETIDLSKSAEFNLAQDETIAEESDNSTVLFINIIDHSMNEDVTGFNVIPKKDFNLRTVTDFHFGALGARGAFVIYLDEDRSSCYLDVDLGRRDFGQTFWRELGDAKLRNVDENVTFCNSTFYDEYRLRMNSQGWRCADDDKVLFAWQWLTCN